jgi:hypothetical protein
MTPKTLTKERKQKVFAILEQYYQDNPPSLDASKHNAHVAEKIVDAIKSRSEIAGEAVYEQIENGQIKIEKPHPDLLDGIIHYEQKPQSIRQAVKEHFKLNVNWDTKLNRQWMEWAVGENITPDQIKLAAERWRSEKAFNWQVPTLKGIFEKWQMLMDSGNSNLTEAPKVRIVK